MSDNRRLTEMKKEYENIEIPAQLSQMVRDTIAKVEKEKIDKIKRRSTMKKRIIG